MASIHKKMERLNTDAYVASGKCNNIGTRHYRPYHHCIQKLRYLYDSDWVDTYSVEEDGIDEISIGTNRKSWRVHECDGYDDYKDCN